MSTWISRSIISNSCSAAYKNNHVIMYCTTQRSHNGLWCVHICPVCSTEKLAEITLYIFFNPVIYIISYTQHPRLNISLVRSDIKASINNVPEQHVVGLSLKEAYTIYHYNM